MNIKYIIMQMADISSMKDPIVNDLNNQAF